MTKKNVSKNTKLSYKRNKRNTHSNIHSNTRKHTRRNTRLKKYNIQTQHAGGWWPFGKKKKPTIVNADPTLMRRPPPPLPLEDEKIGTAELPLNFQPSEDKLTHVWYRNWPDHGVPNMKEFRTFIYTLHKNFDNQDFVKLNNDDSIIIHCSAGVGRSGVVLIILQLLYKYKYTGIITDTNNGINAITILDAIKEARTHRMMLVQTTEQFKFICNFFNIKPAEDYITTFEALAQISGKTITAQKDTNTKLNRYGNILPYDNKIVKLNNEKYINASTMEDLVINGKKIKIILAQCPTEHTVQDFLQMCCEQKVRLIIMLTSLVEKGIQKVIQKCYDYMDGVLNKLLEDNQKHVLYTEYKIKQKQLKYIPEFERHLDVPVLIEEGYVPNNTEHNSSIFNNPTHLLRAIALRKNNLGNEALEWKGKQQKNTQQQHKVVLETMDNKLSKIGKQVRLDVIANLTNNPKSSNTFIDTLYTAMILTEETKLTLKKEFEKYGRQNLLKRLKTKTSLSNIDINSSAKVEEYLKLQIAKTKSPKKIENETNKRAQINANIDNFNYFIDNFNNNIKEEQVTLQKALTNYGSANLIRVLTSINAAELTSSA